MTLDDWLKTRPPEIQHLAKEFPLGSRIETPSGKWWLVGYAEGDRLLISPINPTEDYDGSIEARKPVCASHYRDTKLHG